MMTIREPFLRDSHLLHFTVVHGHVPSPRGPVVAPRRIGVDTGAYASGVLTAVALREGQKPRFLETIRERTRAKR
jgi:serine/threonine protein phosphatase 1